MIGGAPPFALIVEDAAGVEAEIAADRAHVAMGRPGDDGGGLRHHRIMPHHVGMLGKLGERDRGADLDDVRVGADRAQLGDVVDVDQGGRRLDAAADVDDEIGAAAEQPAVGMGGARLDDVVERGRTHQLEVGKSVHQRALESR